MALGGSSKGSSRGRPHGMMLLLAFGAAVFGVMVLHKLRERRIVNLLIHEKDNELMTLQLHLQKERVSGKEARSKMEEIKSKIFSLRTQKMELSNKLMEMKSITESLKEESRALESELEEKQNEIKMLKEKATDSSKENPQVTALTELLKQKEAEIEDMKHRLENQVKVWSVSTDDPSKPSVNLTAMVIANSDKHEVGESKEEAAIFEDRQLLGSMNPKDSEASKSRHDDGSKIETQGKTGGKNADQVQGKGDATEDGKLDRPKDSQDVENFRERSEKSSINVREVVENSSDGEVMKNSDAVGERKSMDGNEQGDWHVENLKSSHYGEGQELNMVSKGGMKQEMRDGSRDGESTRLRGRHISRSKIKDKRWRTISRQRELEKTGNLEDSSMRAGGRTFDKVAMVSKGQREALRDGKLKKIENHQDQEMGLDIRSDWGERAAVVDTKQGGTQLEMPEKSKSGGHLRMRTDSDDKVTLGVNEEGADSNEAMPQKPENFGDNEGMRVRGEKVEDSTTEFKKQGVVDSDAQLLKPKTTQDTEDEQLGNPKNTQDRGLTTRNINEQAADSINQKLDAIVKQPEDQGATGFQNPFDNINNDEKAMDGNGNEEPENLVVPKTWQTIRKNRS